MLSKLLFMIHNDGIFHTLWGYDETAKDCMKRNTNAWAAIVIKFAVQFIHGGCFIRVNLLYHNTIPTL